MTKKRKRGRWPLIQKESARKLGGRRAVGLIKKIFKKMLNEQAAAKEAGETENGERERTRDGEKGEALFNRA